MRLILIYFVTTRLIFTLIGWGTIKYSGIADKHFEKIWSHWDSGYYKDILNKGYESSDNFKPEETKNKLYGFFPLYPVLARALRFFGFNDFFSLFLTSNIFLLFGAYYLYLFLGARYNEELALDGLKIFFLFPSNFVFSGINAESLLFFLLMTSLYYSNQKKVVSSIAPYFLGLTKPTAVFMSPLFVKKKISLLTLFLGMSSFAIFCYFNTGEFLAYTQVKKIHWLASPWQINPLIVLGANIIGPKAHWYTQVNVIFTVLIIGYLLWSHQLMKKSELIFCLLLLLTFLSSGNFITSIQRYVLVLFPIYFLLAHEVRVKSRKVLIYLSFILFSIFNFYYWCQGIPIIV